MLDLPTPEEILTEAIIFWSVAVFLLVGRLSVDHCPFSEFIE
jgi:hypothetical protein